MIQNVFNHENIIIILVYMERARNGIVLLKKENV